MTLDQVNALPPGRFVEAFGDVAEHSSWVAESAAHQRPFASRQAMIDAFVAALKNSSAESQRTVIRAHPDLATRARLTVDSTREQLRAGLDALSPLELTRFNSLNTRYRQRFGFPFIFAVRGATKHQILDSFEHRMDCTPDAEFATALDQVCRIIGFRIEDRVMQ